MLSAYFSLYFFKNQRCLYHYSVRKEILFIAVDRLKDRILYYTIQ